MAWPFSRKPEPRRAPIPHGKPTTWLSNVYDSVSELMSGLGGKFDKVKELFFEAPMRKSEREIEDAITWDGVMETFLFRPCEDATANPLLFSKLSEEEVEAIVEFFGPDETDFWAKVEEAYADMRRSGFAAIWLNTWSVDNAAPMADGEIKSLRELVVFDADCMDADPNGYSQYHSEPDCWVITDPDYPGLKIHKSRLLIFPGRSISKRKRWENNGKGEPETSRIWESWLAWRTTNLVTPNVALTYEQKTVYLQDFNRKMGNDEGRKSIRNKLVDLARTSSFLKFHALDAGGADGKGAERMERTGPPLSGLPEMYDRSERFMVAQSGFPYQTLLGKLPGGGLGGSGETEGAEQEYALFIARQQRKYLFRPIFRFLKLIQPELKRRYQLPFASLKFTFPPLRPLSKKQQKELEKLDAEIDAIYGGSGHVYHEEVREAIAKRGTYAIDPYKLPEVDDLPEDPDKPPKEDKEPVDE